MNILQNAFNTILESTAMFIYIGFIAGAISAFLLLKLSDLIKNAVNAAIHKLKEKKLLK